MILKFLSDVSLIQVFKQIFDMLPLWPSHRFNG